MPKPEKAYPIRLAGTRSYHDALSFASIGDPVTVLRENGNPFDADALVAVDADGHPFGYIPRESWLRRALVDEGRGCSAVVATLDGGVTIAVVLNNDGAIGTRDYVPPA